MRKTALADGQVQEIALTQYGKKKLLGFADSFYDLAKTFTYRGTGEEKAVQDRQTCLIKRRLMEDREILAGNLNEVARIIRKMAEEPYHFYSLKEREVKKIIHICRDNGILVRSIYQTQDTISGMKLAVHMRADDKHVLTVEDASEILDRKSVV